MSTAQTIAPELAAALVAAQRKIAWVGKDATNRHHGYAYASAEAVIAMGRAALNDAGLALDSSVWRFEAASDAQASGGEARLPQPIGRVIVTHLLVHTSGVSLLRECSTPVIPEKGRPADKAECAALTANLAYLLRGLLQIPRGDDPGVGVDERADDESDVPQIRPEPQRQRTDLPRHTYAPQVDTAPMVPFDVHPGEAPLSAASPIDDTWRDVITGAVATIGKLNSVSALLSGLEEARGIAMPSTAFSHVVMACALRCIDVATSMAEHAEATKLLKSLKPPEGTSDLAAMVGGFAPSAWHARAGVAWKAKRAELQAAAASRTAAQAQTHAVPQ